MSFGFSIHFTLVICLFIIFLGSSSSSAFGYSIYKLRQTLDEVEKESENVAPTFFMQRDLLRHKSVSKRLKMLFVMVTDLQTKFPYNLRAQI